MDNNMDYGGSLMAEMNAWRKQEVFFEQYGSKHDLEDKRFLKMKLKEYDRIWMKHRNSATTDDEKALLRVVAFQRKKLEERLYPGLLSKLIRRTVLAIRTQIFGVRQQGPYGSGESYDAPQPQDFTTNNRQTSIDQPMSPDQSQSQKKFLGYDYGPKREQKKGNGMGL